MSSEKSSNTVPSEVLQLIHRKTLELHAAILKRAIIPLTVLVFALIVVIVVQEMMFFNATKVLAIDANGRLFDVPLQEIDEFIYSDGRVIAFANDCATDTFDLTFNNFQRRLERVSSRCYTQSGKDGLATAIGPILKSIKESTGVMHIELTGATSIKRRPGTEWIVDVPVLLTLAPLDGDKITTRTVLTLVIVAENNPDKLRGLAIKQIVQRQAGNK